MAGFPHAVLIQHDKGWEIITPYIADFVDELKTQCYSSAQWLRDKKVWMVSPHIPADTIREVMNYYFDVQEFRCTKIGCCSMHQQHQKSQQPPKQKRPSEFDKALTIIGCLPNASERVIRAAYKAASFDRHPDHGGSNDAMTELNNAWETVKAYRGYKS